MLVSLWEHDEGNQEKTRATVAATFDAAAKLLTTVGATTWVTALMSGLAKVVHWLLGFMDDDHIADQTLRVHPHRHPEAAAGGRPVL